MNNRDLYLIAAGVLIVGYVLHRAGVAAVSAVNPMDPNNLANRAASGVFHALGGNSQDTIGTALYAFLNPGAANYDPNAPAPNSAPAWGLGGGASGGW